VREAKSTPASTANAQPAPAPATPSAVEKKWRSPNYVFGVR
jgi:hypothetical protein